ncbi:hypothetical protein [Amycolatopsis sp. CA-128772]|uniref:ATP dependent DNA ligase n=1 Tax=Amycolatopsis sp. CA-128772 TaxID=2073159 RepID=UPI001E51E30A|nr:hypothetical protein [Amycolatopsis sp. CA-128772]
MKYAGKVGTGFDGKLLTSLHARLQERETARSPFRRAARGQEGGRRRTGVRVKTSHPDKVYYPEDGLTKGDVVGTTARSPTSCCRTCAAAR